MDLTFTLFNGFNLTLYEKLYCYDYGYFEFDYFLTY